MQVIIELIAGFLAGSINAIAGGGTLVSFPILIALGLPPLTANITNTLALCPGYLGGLYAQRKEIAGQKERLIRILPISIIGGIIGGYLLLHLEERLFDILVPYLILLAAVLLAMQLPVKRWLASRSKRSRYSAHGKAIAMLILFLACVYGGYFGAGASVIIIAVLGLIYDDSLVSLNVLKLAISFSVNITAAIYFAFSGRVEWMVFLIMSLGSVIGGFAGGYLVERINPEHLRWTVVIIAVLIAAWFFIEG